MPRRYDIEKASIAIGLKVRRLRLDKGWSLEETEFHGWNNWTHLQKIEGGKPITVATLLRLAKLYGVHPAEILKDI